MMSEQTQQQRVKDLKELIANKDKVEEEIKALTTFLNTGGFGLRGNLVDKEGFPISDVDKVISVREARNKLARLQNDHITLMKTIENDMIALHAITASTQSKMDTETPIKKVQLDDIRFAKVNEVSLSSPAELAGLRVADLIVKFGSINSKNSDNLKAVGQLVRDSEGRPIHVQVKRSENGNDSLKSLSLTPKKWSGQGLLGCLLIPYTS